MRTGLLRRFQRSYFLALFLLLNFPLGCAKGEVYHVDGDKIEVTLALEQAEMMLGEPVYLAFVVQNDSDEGLGVMQGGDDINRLWRPTSFTVTTTTSDGKVVPQPSVSDDVAGNSMMGPQEVPAHGSYTFRLLVSDWATFETPGIYSVVVEKTLALTRWKSVMEGHEKYNKVSVRLRAGIKVVSWDFAKMGQAIAKLGNTMLHGPYQQAHDAAKTLAYVTDTRAVPYFVQASKVPDYDLIFTALDALGQYNDAEAFRALQRGLFIGPKDFGPEVARSKLDNISFDQLRFDAAGALSKSPYSDAFPYLVSKRKELDANARNTIAIGLGTKMNSTEAIFILKELTRDPDDGVRLDAGLSLTARQRQPSGPPTPAPEK